MVWSITSSFGLLFSSLNISLLVSLVFFFSSSLSSSDEKTGLSFGIASPGNLLAKGFLLTISFLFVSEFVVVGFICCMMRRRLVIKESENSAPFSVRAFLKASKVAFLSAKSIINSAVTEEFKIKIMFKEKRNGYENKGIVVCAYLNLCRLTPNGCPIPYIFLKPTISALI